VREVFGLTADGIVLDPELLHQCLAGVETPSSTESDATTATRLAVLVRQRLGAAAAGPCDRASRRLARRILRRGRAAATARQRDLLGLFDQALARVHAGLSIGEERALTRILGARSPDAGLTRWVEHTPRRSLAWEGCRVNAVLIGTGPISGPLSD